MIGRGLIVGCAVLGSALALAPVAAAEVYKGKTSQDRRAGVRSGAQGPPAAVRIRWRAPCADPGFFYTAQTVFLPTFDSVVGDNIRDRGTYSERFRGGRATITARASATRTARGNWRGTFRALKVVVRRNGRVIDRCRMKRATRWSARR